MKFSVFTKFFKMKNKGKKSKLKGDNTNGAEKKEFGETSNNKNENNATSNNADDTPKHSNAKPVKKECQLESSVEVTNDSSVAVNSKEVSLSQEHLSVNKELQGNNMRDGRKRMHEKNLKTKQPDYAKKKRTEFATNEQSAVLKHNITKSEPSLNSSSQGMSAEEVSCSSINTAIALNSECDETAYKKPIAAKKRINNLLCKKKFLAVNNRNKNYKLSPAILHSADSSTDLSSYSNNSIQSLPINHRKKLLLYYPNRNKRRRALYNRQRNTYHGACHHFVPKPNAVNILNRRFVPIGEKKSINLDSPLQHRRKLANVRRKAKTYHWPYDTNNYQQRMKVIKKYCTVPLRTYFAPRRRRILQRRRQRRWR